MIPAGLDEVATYADAIGPWKPYSSGKRARPTTTTTADDINNDGAVNEATARCCRRQASSTKRPTRADCSSIPTRSATRRSGLRPTTRATRGRRIVTFFEPGVDGVFSDFTDTAVAARELFGLQTGVWGEED